MNSAINEILDLARWAPSADNLQPWRFEILNDTHFAIHGKPADDLTVYDLENVATPMALGALLETIELAAGLQKLRCDIERRQGSPDSGPIFDILLNEDEDSKTSSLAQYIRERVTQRRPLKTARLSEDQKTALEESVLPTHRVVWLEGFATRLKVARLLFRSAWIRLTHQQAYKVHTQIIEWGSQFSEDRIPDQAIGLDPIALRSMKWAMASWQRVRFMNRYFAGSVLPRIQLDFIPGMRCGAHFILFDQSDETIGHIDKHLRAGRALQRFWLSATKLGLQLQPEMTPVIFASYARNEVGFEDIPAHKTVATRIAKEMEILSGTEHDPRKAACMGRVGFGRSPKARSRRRSLNALSLDNEVC